MVDADRDMARRREVEEPGAAVAWTAVTIGEGSITAEGPGD